LKSDKICPICDEGNLVIQHENSPVEYKNTTGTIPMDIGVCDACGSESAGKAEMKFNKRALLAFRRSVDGLLSAPEVKRIRKKYRLTQPLAGKLFGGGPVAFNKYENNDVSQSEAMDCLLRIVDIDEDTYWKLVAIKGMKNELMQHCKQYVYPVKNAQKSDYSSTERVVPIEKGKLLRQAKVVSRHVSGVKTMRNQNGWNAN